jgi:hypothetical protein
VGDEGGFEGEGEYFNVRFSFIHLGGF